MASPMAKFSLIILTIIHCLIVYGSFVSGTSAIAPRTEMPQIDDQRAFLRQRAYLGEVHPGGDIDRLASSILARQAARRSGAATSATATAAATALGRLAAVERAQEPDSRSSALNPLTAILYDLVLNLTYLLACAILNVAGAALILFFIHSLAHWRGTQMDEDIAAPHGADDALRAVLTGLSTALASLLTLPFVCLAWTVRSVRASQTWADVRDLRRRAARALSREADRTLLNFRYNAATDRLRLQYYIVSNWLARHGFRVAVVGLAVWAILHHRQQQATSDGVARFGSWQEMAAHFDVPQHFFEPKKEQGSNCHYRREVYEPVRAGVAVEVAWLDSVVGDSVQAPRVDTSVAEAPAGVATVASESAEMVHTRSMGEEWVGYCRRCRQRHCCEVSDEELVANALSLGLWGRAA